ncbi:uncharacterized protein LOC104451823 [Eucalyptus grandis]|uniref:uncharacterized protein LOC104451823 n=1 Tax=Eucalyptus grandis TaxID=71139 RepID=UPI00192EC5B2|nr:uncharacterized protein LOC104451823 [Eucalyptus grandis]
MVWEEGSKGKSERGASVLVLVHGAGPAWSMVTLTSLFTELSGAECAERKTRMEEKYLPKGSCMKNSSEEGESDDGLVEVGDEGTEEIGNEPEVAVDTEPVTKMPIEAPPASKETERQLSKKELKKKGLEELEAVLAEFGYLNREKSSQDGTQDDEQMQKPVESTGEQLSGTEVGARIDETTATENFEDNSTIDMKERLKKLTSSKKKKSSKEMDSAARAAAMEAAVTSAKVASTKKKEKNHYNHHSAR